MSDARQLQLGYHRLASELPASASSYWMPSTLVSAHSLLFISTLNTSLKKKKNVQPTNIVLSSLYNVHCFRGTSLGFAGRTLLTPHLGSLKSQATRYQGEKGGKLYMSNIHSPVSTDFVQCWSSTDQLSSAAELWCYSESDSCALRTVPFQCFVVHPPTRRGQNEWKGSSLGQIELSVTSLSWTWQRVARNEREKTSCHPEHMWGKV